LETGLRRLGFGGGVFGESGFSHPFLHGFAGLLGFLAVSALIVALNSFLVLAVLGTLEMIRVGKKAVGGDQTTWGVIPACSLVTDKVYLVSESRAPPDLFGILYFSFL
jgi:apolipoprotein N-acyltransferase